MSKINKKIIKRIIALCIVVGAIFSVFTVSDASLYTVQKFFSNRTDVFNGMNTSSGSIGDVTEYPINTTGTDSEGRPQFSTLGFDILFGTSRPLLSYTGEIPRAWKDAEGLTLTPYTEFSPGNSTVSSMDYFGIEKQDIKEMAKDGKELQTVEELSGDRENSSGQNSVTSVRMYALTRSSSRLGDNFLNRGVYSITQGLCNLSTKLLGVLIYIKNINIGEILIKLKLEELLKLFNKVFLRHNGEYSVFMILAICSFIFAIVGFSFRWVRGKEKTNSVYSILLIAFLGLTVVYMSLNSGMAAIGTSAANRISSAATDLVYDSVSSGRSIWKSTASGGNSGDSTVVAYNETTLINKTLIELQIQNQFGVNSISDLKTRNLGGGPRIRFSKLNAYEKDLSKFNNNLGYYFWFANSPSPELSGGLTTSFRNNDYNSASTAARLEGVLSYLQQSYNRGSAAKKRKILNMVDHLANPKIGAGSMMYVLLTIEYILLALILFKLAFRIVLSKAIVAGSVLGMSIAGPLLITTRQRLVNCGKTILFSFVSFTIQVFILSVLFDIILNVLGVIIAPNVLSIALALALTLGLFIFLPKVYGELDRLFEGINRAIGADSINNMTRSAKRIASNGYNNFVNKPHTVTKTVKDTQGNKHKVKVTGRSALQKGLGIFGAATGAGGPNANALQGFSKIGDQISSENIESKKRLSDDLHDNTSSKVNKLDEYKQSKYASIYKDYDSVSKSGGHSFSSLDYNQLTADEQSQYLAISNIQSRIQSRNLDEGFQALQKKVDSGEGTLSPYEQKMMDSHLDDLKNLSMYQDNLVRSVDDRINQEALSEYGKEIKDASRLEANTDKQIIRGAKKGEKVQLSGVSDNIADAQAITKGVNEGDVNAVAKGATSSEKTHQRVLDKTATTSDIMQDARSEVIKADSLKEGKRHSKIKPTIDYSESSASSASSRQPSSPVDKPSSRPAESSKDSPASSVSGSTDRSKFSTDPRDTFKSRRGEESTTSVKQRALDARKRLLKK